MRIGRNDKKANKPLLGPENSSGGGFSKSGIRFWMFLLAGLFSVCGVGYGAWLSYEYLSNDNVANSSNSGGISVAPTVDEDSGQEYIDISVNKTFSSSDRGTSTSEKDYFVTDFKWTKTGSDTSISSDLSEYFSFYDLNDPIGEDSPHLLSNNLEGAKVSLENHMVYPGGVKSSTYYRASYDVVDTANTPTDAEIQADIERTPWVTGKRASGWTGRYGEVSYVQPSTTTSVTLSGFRIFYTCQDNGTYSSNYRIHLYYKAKMADGTSKLCRITSHNNSNESYYNNSSTVTSLDNMGDNVPVTFTHTTYTSGSSTLLHSSISSVKTSCSRVRGTVTMGGMSSYIGTVDFYLTENRVQNSNAGYDPRYQIIDMNRDRTSVSSDTIVSTSEGGSGVVDFDPTVCTNFITNYLKEKGGYWNNASYTMEIMSEDDSGGQFTHTPPTYGGDEDHKYIKLYAARLKNSSGNYGRYRFFIFYYEKGSDELRCLNNDSDYFTGFKADTSWPQFYTWPLDGSTYSYLRTNPTSGTSYIRWRAVRSIDNANTGNPTAYLEARNVTTVIDLTKTREDFPDYLYRDYARWELYSANNFDSESITDEDVDSSGNKYIDNPFPWLKCTVSRRKNIKSGNANNGKYYYYRFRTYFIPKGGNGIVTNNWDLYSTDATSNYVLDEWPKFTVNSDTASSSPSIINTEEDGYYSSSPVLRFSRTYTPNTASSASTNTGSFSYYSGSTLYPNDYQDEDTSTPISDNERIKAIYNRRCVYSYYNEVDMERSHTFSGYFDSTNSNRFKIYHTYFQSNKSDLTSASGVYLYNHADASNGFYGGYRYVSGNSETVTRKFITPDLVEGYSYAGARIKKVNRMSQAYVLHDFKSSGGDTKSYGYPLGNALPRNYLEAYLGKLTGQSHDFTYHIRLYPRNESAKTNMHEIIKNFSFSLSFDVESRSAFARGEVPS